jgi:hypothetical protein
MPINQAHSVTIKKRYKQYSKANIENAKESVQNGEQTIYSASKAYGVPYNSLKDCFNDDSDKKKGKPTVISAASEAKIADWIKVCAQRGDPRTEKDLLDAAAQYDKFENKPAQFGENGPSKKWLRSFISRHPDVTFRKPEAIGKASATVCIEDIDKFFSTFKEYLHRENLEHLLLRPDAWYNLDETSFDLNTPPKRVLAAKGTKSVYTVNSSNLHDNITTTFCFGADGSVLPPQIIFNKSFSKLDEVYFAAGESGTKFFFTQTGKGWQVCELFVF